MMLAMVRGTSKPVCEAKWSGAATQSAIKGQSLLQSGSDGSPGQQGMWSIASEVSESTAARSMIVGKSIAIATRAIGANRRPAIATDAMKRPMIVRSLTLSSYHI
jgi:hypothetical protein